MKLDGQSDDQQTRRRIAVLSTIRKMNLVTREEVEEQEKTLLQLREKIEAMEELTTELQRQIENKI